ncbi:hypothetical protein OS493_018507 [Desmophyllum pertusum]|uniref:SET domain-containing protein n=1 Tax=Desmophyllum pertusum TaxID=174260 RepID=A0A9X0A1N7_9CNID|nr:hypothetical protein OS493_018507 [Desmophyllum pertusum]
MPPKFGNVMLKHKRAVKSLFLDKFIRLSVVMAEEPNFLSSEDIFEEYERVVSLWTDEDSLHGQTKFLMKRGSFYRLHDVPSDPRGAGICAFASRDIKKSEIICKYEGEVISLEEAKRREHLYQEQGKVCALMVLESKGSQIA